MKFTPYRTLDHLKTREHLETYVQERMRLERRPMKFFTYGLAGGLLLGLLLVLAGCTAHADEKVVAPLVALNITRCDGALVLYILIDSDHMLRFDQEHTTLMVRGPDGKLTEHSGPSTPWSKALELAETAGITANTDVKCDGGIGT